MVLIALALLGGCASTAAYVEYMNLCLAEKTAIVADCDSYAKERVKEDADYKRVEWQTELRENVALCSADDNCMLVFTGRSSSQCNWHNQQRIGARANQPYCIPPHARKNDYEFWDRDAYRSAFENMRGY